MKIFNAWKLTHILDTIEWARRDLLKYEIDNGKRDELVPDEVRTKWLDSLVNDAREFAESAELPATNSRINPRGGFTVGIENGLTYQELEYELRILRESIQIDLDSKYVFVVESEKEKYNTREFILDTWGLSSFYFPSIRKDAVASMRSYVHGLDTACVFHLMRITEVGLRALGPRMHVALARHRQLEWGQWNEILKEMRKKADLVANRPPGNARDELLEFYRGAIAEFEGYKDAYRNFVMHMRERIEYGPNEARSLIERVSHFMSRLSSKIDEQGLVLTDARKKKIFAKFDAEREEEKKNADEQAKQGIRELRQDNAQPNLGSTRGDTSGTQSGEDAKTNKAEG